MNRIKDLIYNLSDIFVALVILAAAAGIIYWRVGAIMDYPAYAAGKAESPKTAEVDFTDVDLTPGLVDENLNKDPENFDAPAEPQQNEEPQASADPSGPAEQPGSQENTDPKPGFTVETETKFTITAGASCDKVAELLLQQGLIESKKDFINMVVEKKADTKIKQGTFTIPAGSTLSDIIDIITK